MALNANAIVTLAEAKQQLNIVTSNTTEDSVIEAMINEISDAVEYYTQRKIFAQSVTNEIRDGDGTNVIYPKYYPLIQLSTASSPTSANILAAVQYRDTPDSAWTDIETDTDHIFYDTTLPYIELYDLVFPIGRRNIRLNYKAGYSTVPGDIKQVVLEKIQMRWKESLPHGGWLGQSNTNQSEAGGSSSATLRELDKRWNEILDRYRTRSLA
jgi:hypothetical protein